MSKAKIVVLGGGYAGLMTVTKLQSKLGLNEADITLVNKHDYHYETTWLHEASAGTIEYDAARYGIESVLKSEKVNFIKAIAEKVDPENKKVILSTGEISYDYLVIALGGESETFGIKGLKEHAFSLVSINSSRQVAEHIEKQFAEFHMKPVEEQKHITIVVGGAGFTGIEFLGEITRRIPELCEKYKVNREVVKIICVESAPTILPGFDASLIEYAMDFLQKRGVEFRIKQAVKECTADGIVIAVNDHETEFIEANTVLWAAGIKGNSFIDVSGFNAVRGRIKVTPELTVPEYNDIFVIGDCSIFMNKETNQPYPPTAQIALQEGAVCAKNIVALIRNEPLTKFNPNIVGAVCSLGNRNAVGVVYNRRIKGIPAAVLKKVIDNKAFLQIGGPSLLLKKLKINFL